MFRIGTSGYSFEDWRGAFYPQDLPKGKMLDFYATQFDTVEINSTYYGIPSPSVFLHMANKTRDDFHFIVKVHADVTHKRKDSAESIQKLLEAVKPLEDAGKLQGFLAQFPYSFKNNPDSRKHLKEVRAALGDHKLFAEFRHRSWLTEKVLDGLKEYDIGFVSVDEPQIGLMMPPEAHVTNGVGYVRFHGRNSETWYDHDKGDRYDYLYSEQELQEWIPRIQQLESHASLIYLFFNNCHLGQAVKNAKMMKELLE
jgi:uncharacterized protein YecE (DUF72 family)